MTLECVHLAHLGSTHVSHVTVTCVLSALKVSNSLMASVSGLVKELTGVASVSLINHLHALSACLT